MNDDTTNDMYEPGDMHEPGDELVAAIRVTLHAGGPVPPEALLDQAEEVIQANGLCLVGDYVDGRPMTHTIGLHKRRLPDIITLGNCLCSDHVVAELAKRQFKGGEYRDHQVTQIHGTIVRLTAWPYTAQLPMFQTYYARFRDAPRMLLAEKVT